MTEIVFLWHILKEAGQVAPLVVLSVLFIVWRNDLKHIRTDISELKTILLNHLQWHSKDADI